MQPCALDSRSSLAFPLVRLPPKISKYGTALVTTKKTASRFAERPLANMEQSVTVRFQFTQAKTSRRRQKHAQRCGDGLERLSGALPPVEKLSVFEKLFNRSKLLPVKVGMLLLNEKVRERELQQPPSEISRGVFKTQCSVVHVVACGFSLPADVGARVRNVARSISS